MPRHDWPAIIAELQRVPKRWRLLYPNHSTRLAVTIRLRRARALRLPNGRLEVRVTNQYSTDGGTKGDIWLRWNPTEPPSSD